MLALGPLLVRMRVVRVEVRAPAKGLKFAAVMLPLAVIEAHQQAPAAGSQAVLIRFRNLLTQPTFGIWEPPAHGGFWRRMAEGEGWRG